MKKVFLFVFSPPPGGADPVLNFLDTRPEIADWQAAFPYGVFLVSDQDSDALRDVIHEGTGLRWFIVTELDLGRRGTSVSGWLPKAAWSFLGEHAGQENWPQEQHRQPA